METLEKKIVVNPIKIDLHIHSKASMHKDGDLVEKGTKDNLHNLWDKLKENQVDVFAITDHDCFDYSLYSENKTKEYDGTFKKVFPGIEFSVGFFNKDTKEQVQVHVIAIFNDEDEEKLKSIKNILPLEKPLYDCGNCFSEEKFRSLLEKIDLDVVLIAHQKNSITSKNPRKNDASSAGNSRFSDFINAEYFESFEFKSAKAGIFNNLFKAENDANDNMRFITGSDCHQWDFYPATAKDDKEEMVFSYLKCLPTFRGLAMALTDSSRIRIDNNFFADTQYAVKEIEIKVGERSIIAPLSPGINVIIGDNSIGKSMFLHAMTNYRSFDNSHNLSKDAEKSYKKFLQEKEILVKTTISESQIYKFDSQGEIRSRFEDGNAFEQPFVESKYPEPTDSGPYISFINKQFDKLYSEIQKRFDINNFVNNLPDIFLPPEPLKTSNLIVTKISAQDKVETHGYAKIQKLFKSILSSIEELKENISNNGDLEQIKKAKSIISPLAQKYTDLLENTKYKNSLIDAINIGITNFKTKQQNAMNLAELQSNNFQEAKSQISSIISSLVNISAPEKHFKFDFEPLKVVVNKQPFGEIAFVNRFKGNISSITPNYCDQILKKVLLSGEEINLDSLTESSLTSIIKDKQTNQDSSSLNLLKVKISSILDEEFSPVKAIVKNDGQDDADYSSGFNSSKYFDLISNDISAKGIYIVDQPEDDVSQASIKSKIIPDFRTMRNYRQMIIVTHNPQFVVNLDADNVLYFFDGEEGFNIKSGALEYIDKAEDCDIIRLVSDNLEGGIDSLKKRWKRYEKGIDIKQESN
jgi:predicted ATPase